MDRKYLLTGLVAIAVVVLGVVAYFVISGSSSDAVPTSGPLSIVVAKDDHTLGSPNAPLKVLEYASPQCPHCAHFDMDVLPQFKQQYINTGKVYYIFRVFPLSPVDVVVESMAHCLPEDNYFQFLDLMYTNQAKWDPDGYVIPDVHGALVQMGNIAGMNAQKVDSCIGDQAEAQRIEKVGQDAQTNYGVSGTPTFIINGVSRQTFLSFKELKDYIDPILAKK